MSWPVDRLPHHETTWIERLNGIRAAGVPAHVERMIDAEFLPTSAHSLASHLNAGRRKIPTDVRWVFRGTVRWERRPRGEEVHVGRIIVYWEPWE